MAVFSEYTARGSGGPVLWSVGNQQFGVMTTVDYDEFIVCEWNRTTRALTSTFNLSTVTGNPFDLPLTPDEHECPALGVDPDGYIWIAGKNRENTALEPRIVRSENPLDISSWVDGKAQVLANIPDIGSWVYFHFAQFSDGELYMSVSQRHATDDVGYWYVTTKAEGDTNFQLRANVTAGDPSSAGESFYRSVPVIDSNDRIHIFGAWDLTHVGISVNHHSYLYSDDRGETWRAMDGTALTLPFNATDASGVACRTGVDFGDTDDELYSSGAAIDGDGYPCGMYTDRTASRQKIVRWNGTSWEVNNGFADFGGGTIAALINWRDDLWIAARTFNTRQYILRRVASPNEDIYLTRPGMPAWFAWADPIVLRDDDVLEFLIPDGDTPRIVTYGDHARRAAA